MGECYGKNFILNGELHPGESFNNSIVYEGDSIYEVIRLVKGNPVFFNDHMDRLRGSVMNQKKEMIADSSALAKGILKLTRSDKKREINLKIVFNYSKGFSNYLIYFIETAYPTQEQIRNGVKGILYEAERKDPGSKVINHKLRSDISHTLIKEGGYEAILVNENNLITEGSRSNIFLFKNNILYTAPDGLILKGITRKHILEICTKNRIVVKLECVNVNDISDYEAVFMTGTSPMVLSFDCIGDIHFNAKLPLVEELRKLYLVRVEESIRLFRP